MSSSMDEPVIKRPRLELAPSVQLPDEILARIWNFVDDPWFKIKCKGLSRRFYKVLQLKECWDSTEVQVELLDGRSIKLNNRTFSIVNRLEAFEAFMKVIHAIKRFSYCAPVYKRDDLALVKALFGRIINMKPIRLSHLSFAVKLENPNQLKPLPNLLRSCSSVLRSVNLDMQILAPNRFRSQEKEAIESVWNDLETCNELKHVSVSQYYRQLSTDYHRIRSALSFKSLETLALNIQFYGDANDNLSELLKSLPSLEKLSLKMSPSRFVKSLIDNHASTLRIKELVFTDDIYGSDFNKAIFFQAFDLDLFPNLTSLSMNCNCDPVPVIDRIFQFWCNRRPPFVLNWDHNFSIGDFKSILQRAVIDKGGRVGAGQTTCDETRSVYILSKNKSVILFSIQKPRHHS